MTIFPDRRLLAALALWTAAAVAVVVWPALWLVLLAALVVLVTLVAWDARLLWQTPAVTVVRRVPARAFVGREVTVTLEIESPARSTSSVDVLDEAPADLVRPEPRFRHVALTPGERTTLTWTGRPSQRGDHTFGPVIVLVHSPLGFLRHRRVLPTDDVLRVYPDASRFVSRAALDPRRLFATLGVRPARRRGSGTEFESLRDYVAGDDVRRIDWAATARRGKPVTRLYQHERNHTVVIALDTSRLMGGRAGERTKLDHAVDGALALAYAALSAGDRLGLVAFDRDIRGHLAPRAHRRHLGPFVEFLRTLAPRAVEADYQTLVRHLGVEQGKRALIIVLTDFVEADSAALIAPLVLLARRHRVLLVTLRDPAYARLRTPDRPGDPLDLYRRIVLDELLAEREVALGRLRRSGLETADLVPDAITAAVLNRYLALRHAEGA